MIFSHANLPFDFNALRLFPDIVNSYSVHFFESLGSTNDKARMLAAAGCENLTVIIADRQTEGRGRFGRKWHSPPGVNIYMSIVLAKISNPLITLLNYAVALAVARAVRESAGIDVRTKWPNDLYCSGKKFCGILTESVSSGGRILYSVTGIGINVNQAKEELPDNIRENTTGISIERGGGVARGDIIIQVMQYLNYYLRLLETDPKVIRKEWCEISMTVGSRVNAVVADTLIEGEAVSLDEHGALIVRLDTGESITLTGREPVSPRLKKFTEY